MSKASFFQERAVAFENEALELQKKFQLFAVVRIIVFLLALAFAIYFANERNAAAIFFTVFPSVVLFSIIVKAHNKLRYRKDHASFLVEINHNELLRIEGKLNHFDQGNEYIDENHPYSSDLDIFGKNSLFQLLNRTATETGRNQLADWLLKPANKEEILSRQEAVIELKNEVNWRQEFQASSMHFPYKESNFEEFTKWLHLPSKVNKNLILRISSFLFPALIIIGFVGIYFSWWSYQLTLPLFLINGILLSRTFELAQETSKKAALSLGIIKSYRSQILLAENKTCKSGLLLRLQNTFKKEGFIASAEINKLSKIMEQFDARSNPIYFLIDLIFLYDIHLLNQTESWRMRNESHIEDWIESISKIEALSSLSGSLHTHEGFTIPQINQSFEIQFKDAGHPLIDPKERVTNNFMMSGLGAEVIITGSNMSGKSTFLRTLGINMVMAFAGGPVCCSNAIFPVMKVYTSMRTHDNLEEHISSFYAELKRIKGLLEILSEASIPVFYLLDEILKGTNSVDRHLGAESLIIQLLTQNGMGLISTHDLTLSSLAEKYEVIKNYSFNSTLINDEIIFDYKIHEGVCKGFNASKLMEKMGIVLKNE